MASQKSWPSSKKLLFHFGGALLSWLLLHFTYFDS